jgi:hypothetical protein
MEQSLWVRANLALRTRINGPTAASDAEIVSDE